MNKKKQSLEILSSLININTANNNELNIVNKIISILEIDDKYYKIIDHGNNRASLIIDIKGKTDETFAFCGHLDTVSVADESVWNTNPFIAHVENDIVFGRGSTDMKGGLTAMIMLCKKYLTNTAPVNLRFIFTADEESGGIGITKIKEDGFLDDVNYLIISEPSFLNVGICEKGAIWTKLKVTGKSCHVANPKEGSNALEHSFRIFDEIKENVLSSFSAHKYLGETSCSATIINSGISINIIPEYSELFFDIRTIPSDKNPNDLVINLINEVVENYTNKNQNVKIVAETLHNRLAIESNIENKLYNLLEKVYDNKQLDFNKVGINYFTDAAIGLSDLDIPFVILGPGDPNECHKIDEKIDINQVVKVYEIYDELIELF